MCINLLSSLLYVERFEPWDCSGDVLLYMKTMFVASSTAMKSLIRPMTISMRKPRWHYPCLLLLWCWFWLIPFKSRTDLSGDSEPSETQRRRRQIPGEGGWRGEEPGPGGDAADTDNTELSYRQYAGWAKWQGIMWNGYVTDDWLYHSLLQVRSLTVVLAISLLDRGITPVTADGNPDPLPHPQILIRNPGLIKVVYSFILIL